MSHIKNYIFFRPSVFFQISQQFRSFRAEHSAKYVQQQYEIRSDLETRLMILTHSLKAYAPYTSHLSHYTYVTMLPMPVRYLHGTPRTNLTHSAGVHTPTRVCATRRILSLSLPPHPLLSAHALGRSVGHERERFASLRSRVIRDVTMSVTSLPEYPAQTVRRKLGR